MTQDFRYGTFSNRKEGKPITLESIKESYDLIMRNVFRYESRAWLLGWRKRDRRLAQVLADAIQAYGSR